MSPGPVPLLYRTLPAHAHTRLTHGSHTASTGRVGVTDTTPRGCLLMGPTGGDSPDGQSACVFAGWERIFTPSRRLTFTDRGFSCPLHICFARPVLRSTCQEEPRMAGVHQGVAEGRQVDRAHVRVGWRFRLSAGVGWNGIYSLGNTETLFVRNLTYVSKERKKVEMTIVTLLCKIVNVVDLNITNPAESLHLSTERRLLSGSSLSHSLCPCVWLIYTDFRAETTALK